MAKLQSLTDKQRDVLRQIEAVRDVTVRRLLELYPDCTPTEWVSTYTLVYTHHVQRRVVEALVRKGFLTMRDSGGFGPQVKIVASRYL